MMQLNFFTFPKILKRLFIMLFFIEILLFILIAKYIGIFNTLGLIILTSVTGIVLLRFQQERISRKMTEASQSGNPFAAWQHQTTPFVIGSFLLILPGFFTDFLGILCLIPGLGNMLLKSFIAQTGKQQTTPPPQSPESNVIEGECWEEKEDNKKN